MLPIIFAFWAASLALATSTFEEGGGGGGGFRLEGGGGGFRLDGGGGGGAPLDGGGGGFGAPDAVRALAAIAWAFALASAIICWGVFCGTYRSMLENRELGSNGVAENTYSA